MEEEKKECPYCGEEIPASAVKCKHCGEWVEDYNDEEDTDSDETGKSGDTLRKVFNWLLNLIIFITFFTIPFIFFEKCDSSINIGTNDKRKIQKFVTELKDNFESLISDKTDNHSTKKNPLGIIKIIPDFENRQITLQSHTGIIMYNDEDVDKYKQYLRLFYFAHIICTDYNIRDNAEIRSYLEENFTYVLANLPLDDSYPENVKEAVNEVYYDNLDAANTVSVTSRGYGYITCKYYWNNYINHKRRFDIKRSEELNGALIIH